MNVLMLNGSPHKGGCTFTALTEVGKALQECGVDYEIWQLGVEPVRDCTACGACKATGRCVFDDNRVNEFIERAQEADGFVFGSPVYYAHPSGRILSFLDRVFYAGLSALTGKPGAAVASARRAGTTATIDVLNKYFTINSMPVVSSTYWNMVHGNKPADVLQDEEGLRTMRNIGRAMADMVKAYAAARDAGIELHAPERGAMTNFIR